MKRPAGTAGTSLATRGEYFAPTVPKGQMGGFLELQTLGRGVNSVSKQDLRTETPTMNRGAGDPSAQAPPQSLDCLEEPCLAYILGFAGLTENSLCSSRLCLVV